MPKGVQQSTIRAQVISSVQATGDLTSADWLTSDVSQAEAFWTEAEANRITLELSPVEAAYCIYRESGMYVTEAMSTALAPSAPVLDMLSQNPWLTRRVVRQLGEWLDITPKIRSYRHWVATRGTELEVITPDRYAWSREQSDDTLRTVIEEMKGRMEQLQFLGREVPSSLASAMIQATKELNRTHAVDGSGSDGSSAPVQIMGAGDLVD